MERIKNGHTIIDVPTCIAPGFFCRIGYSCQLRKLPSGLRVTMHRFGDIAATSLLLSDCTFAWTSISDPEKLSISYVQKSILWHLECAFVDSAKQLNDRLKSLSTMEKEGHIDPCTALCMSRMVWRRIDELCPENASASGSARISAEMQSHDTNAEKAVFEHSVVSSNGVCTAGWVGKGKPSGSIVGALSGQLPCTFSVDRDCFDSAFDSLAGSMDASSLRDFMDRYGRAFSYEELTRSVDLNLTDGYGRLTWFGHLFGQFLVRNIEDYTEPSDDGEEVKERGAA